jgi:hypothetical protein
VHLITRLVLDRNALSALDCKVCSRSHSTAPISHGAVENAMAYGNAEISSVRGCTQLQPMHSIVMRLILVHMLNRESMCSIARTGTPCIFSIFLQHFNVKDPQHKKTLKQAKSLENNKAKGLTNINYGVQINIIWHSSVHIRILQWGNNVVAKCRHGCSARD